MSKPTMTPTGMSHIGICVANLDRSLAFYRDLLGMQVIKDEMIRADVVPDHLYANVYCGPRRIVYLRCCESPGAPIIVLSENPEGKNRARQLLLDEIGFHHISISVPSVAAFMEQMAVRGARTFGEPGSYRENDGSVRSVFYKDPDGMLVQIDEEVFEINKR